MARATTGADAFVAAPDHDRALDLQITAVTGPPVGTKASVIGGSGGKTKNNTRCRYNVAPSFDPKDGSPPSYATVSVEGIRPDAATTWRQMRQTARATPLSSPTTDFPNLPGGTDGFWGGTEVQALHAQGGRAYDFWIAGSKVINNGGSHLQAQGDRAHEIEAPLGTKLGSELK